MASATERALASLDAPAMLAFLQLLVRTPSVYLPDTPGANEEQVARLIFELLASWGWHPRWEEAAPGRPNVVAELPGSLGSGPLLLFEGHTDVVTPGDPGAWRYAPFGGEIVEVLTGEGPRRRLYGRGAADMKGGVAAMLFAARAIQQAGAPFRGSIRLLIPADEEGLMLGIKALVARGHAEGALGAIVCEPEGREVCIAQKGALRLRLLARGRVAHGAMPEEGVNALAAMVRLLASLADLEAELQAVHPPHPLLGKVYLSPTVARAPLSGDASQLNCLPDACDAFLDIRTIPSLGHAALLGAIRERMDAVSGALPGSSFDIEVLDDRPSTEIAVDHPLVRALEAAHLAIYGVAPALGGVPGATDGTILTRDAAVPVVVYGPGDKRIPHQPDEFVELEEVERAARVYIRAALQLLGDAAGSLERPSPSR
jgi:succinyl-diaminopimelate desuccinylase